MVHRRALMVAGAIGALAFGSTALMYQRSGDVRIDFERGYEGAFVESFHPRERADGSYFRWTGDASFVVMRHLPPRGTIRIEARLRTTRPEGTPLPELSFTANGVTVHRARALPGAVSYHFEFPSTASTLKLGIESETFEAAGGRKLGVQVLGIVARLQEKPSWVVPAVWMASAAVLLFLAGMVFRLPATGSGAGALGLSLVFVSFLSHEAVLFSAYPRHVFALAGTAIALAVLLRVLFDRIGWLYPRERGWALSLLVLLLLVKLAVVTYPLTLSSDADFQANRMSELLRGNLYPTSVTQHHPPFRIPYPVALYAVAAPVAMLGVELVPALEIVTAVFDVLVSALLLFAAVRFLDDFRAGVLAALLYQFVPMNALSFSAGNFTNLFAVSMLAATFVLVALSYSSGSPRAIVAAALTTFLALTAHFGMLLEGSLLVPSWLASIWLCPAPVRDRRLLLALSLGASFLLAGTYYLGYLDLVTSQWERALSGGSGSTGGLQTALVSEQIGLVFLATAILGSLSFVRHPMRGALSALATAWLGITVLFFLLDLVTPIEIRYWLQSLPLLALFSGSYLSRAFDRGVVGKTAAAAALLYVGFVGLRTLYQTVLFRYH